MKNKKMFSQFNFKELQSNDLKQIVGGSNKSSGRSLGKKVHKLLVDAAMVYGIFK